MIAEKEVEKPGKAQFNSKLQDDSNIKIETNEELQIYPTFESMKLKEELLRGIYCYGIFSLTKALINLRLFSREQSSLSSQPEM
jgi:hypothetical protein